QHTLSNSGSTKPAYSIIPVDYIEYILNNPTIASNLYFGSEIKLCANNVTYQASNFLHYHQDKAIKFALIRSVVEVNKRQLIRADSLVPYSGFPRHLRSMNRKACGMNMEELWLVEGQECLIIPENITQINVWLKDLDRPVEYEYFVTEILYSFNSCQYGLSAKPVLDTLYWDRHLQSPQDAYYVLAGKATRLLDITLRYLNTNGEAEIIEHLKNIYKLTRNDHAIIKPIELWVVEAKLLKLAFSTTMTNDTYKELRSLFEKEQIGFLKIFLDIFKNLPNVYVNVHLPQHARTFATFVNTSVRVKEMVHRIYKNMVPHTNYKNIELDLLRRYNTSFVLTHLFDGSKDYHFPITINKLSNIFSDISLYSSLCKQYTTDQNLKINDNDDIEEIEIILNLIPKNFIDIVLRNKWPKTRANIEEWSTKLSSQHPLFHDLHISYSEYFSLQSAFLNNKLEFFDYISYTIIENDRKSTRLKFHVGEIIEIEEESEGLTYAKIQAILQYQANNNESAIFFILKWLQATNTKDLILDCPYYKQIMNNQQFLRIYPISYIHCIQKIHFLPACMQNHDQEHATNNDQKSIKNKFFIRLYKNCSACLFL
ncbi:14146_t:CDS:2, partial [Racocetra persica]